MKKGLLIIILSLVINYSFGQQFTDLYGDYFGQTPPGDTAVIFAPGIISLPDRYEYKIIFSPSGNECFFTIGVQNTLRTYYTKRLNNVWTEQVIASFSENENCMVSSFSADGNRLYFDKYSIDFSTNDIWMVERTAGNWGEPKILPVPINSTSNDSYYAETIDSLIYISSTRSGGLGGDDIWCLRYSTDKILQAVNLGATVNSSYTDAWTCIAPDGSFLIFSSDRPGGYGVQDLYVCFNKGNNEWTKAISMGKNGGGINIANRHQFNPSLSPDGKYLFFGRHTPNGEPLIKQDFYWVSTHILVGLKKAAYAPKLSTQIPAMNIKTDSVINYVIPASTFSCEYSVDSLKYTATLSNGSTLPSWLHFNPDTKTLSGTSKRAETNTIKITATNKDTVSDSCIFKISVIK